MSRLPRPGSGRLDPGRWWPARLRGAALATSVAALTAAGALFVGAPFGGRPLASLYVFVTVAALLFPAAITVQVVLGQILVGGLLLATGGPGPAVLAALFCGVVLGAELLAVVARLDLPVERRPVGDTRRALVAAALAGAVFIAVTATAGVGGPSGILALAGVVVACLLLARLLTGSAAAAPPGPE